MNVGVHVYAYYELEYIIYGYCTRILHVCVHSCGIRYVEINSTSRIRFIIIITVRIGLG